MQRPSSVQTVLPPWSWEMHNGPLPLLDAPRASVAVNEIAQTRPLPAAVARTRAVAEPTPSADSGDG